MTKTPRSKVWSRHGRAICAAIFNRSIPDCATNWPIVEVMLNNSVIVGSGESASWKSVAMVRRDGKRLFQGSPEKFETFFVSLKPSLLEVCKIRGGVLFLEKPQPVTLINPEDLME